MSIAPIQPMVSPLVLIGILLPVVVLVIGYLVTAGVIIYPAVPPDVVITPVDGGLLTETPVRRKLLPWRDIPAVFDVSGWILIQHGLTVLAIPKSCDPDGKLWALLRDRLIGKKMLVSSTLTRHAIFNTARGAETEAL